MAFKAVIANATRYPYATILVGSDGRRALALSTLALAGIGEPRAVAFEWDDEESLLRVSAAAPDAPEASPLPRKASHGVRVTMLLKQLGVTVPETTRFPTRRDGPLAVILDLSEYRNNP